MTPHNLWTENAPKGCGSDGSFTKDFDDKIDDSKFLLFLCEVVSSYAFSILDVPCTRKKQSRTDG